MRIVRAGSLVLFLVVLGWWLGATDARAAAVTLPSPLGDYQFTLLSTDSSGAVYACDGDSVYRLSGSTFSTVATGIVSAVGGAEVDPSGFAVNAAGTQAFVATGYTGRLVEVNLAAPSSAAELTGATRSWAYGNYGMAIDPVSGKVFLTDSLNDDIYMANTTGSGSLTLVKHFTGSFGGGLAFSPQGALYIPVATGYAAWPTADNFPVDLYKFSRSWLDAVEAGNTPTTDATCYATGLQVSGTGLVAAGADGAVYIEAANAIYRVAPDGTITTFLGDPSKNVFDADMAGAGFMGLAFDPTTDQLYYGYRDTDTEPLQMGEHSAPEPATLALLGLGAAALLRRKKGKC